jgi:hypothetical protein
MKNMSTVIIPSLILYRLLTFKFELGGETAGLVEHRRTREDMCNGGKPTDKLMAENRKGET